MNELIPPQYVNIRADVVYSLDLSDPLCRTYIRLAGLAWRDKLGRQQNLPPLHEEVLCKMLGLKRSSLWGQLQALRGQGLIAWTSRSGVFAIRILSKSSDPVQNFGLTLNDDDDLKQQDQESTSSTTKRVQSFGLTLSDEGVLEREDQDSATKRVQSFGLTLNGDDDVDLKQQDQKLTSSTTKRVQSFGLRLSDEGVLEQEDQDSATKRVQSFGLRLNDDDVDLKQQDQELSSSTTKPVQNFGLKQDALQKWGIAPGSAGAERLLSLQSVTPELIQAWGEHLSAQHNADLVPILLAYQLEHSTHPPKTEKRGSGRSKSAENRQAQLPIHTPAELPQSVQDDLAAIAWSGLTDEVLRSWSQNANLVQAWLDYAIGLAFHQVKTSRAALFRAGIRSGQLPPYRIPRQPAQLGDEESEYESDDDDGDEWMDDTAACPWPQADPLTLKTWQWAIGYLKMEMPQATFDRYVLDTVPVNFDALTGVFTVGTPNAYAREWLAERLTSTVQRQLIGYLNRTVTVEFICPEMVESPAQ